MTGGTYLNPVYPRSLPDPFVLKVRGEYWAYGTGVFRDGRCFGILSSPDLVSWREVGGALDPLPGDFPCYWAPEVACYQGRFYLYYSVGDEATMEIRVAEAGHPAGPFVDAGRRLTTEPFAIDPHVFADAGGTRWLFYATDFLDHSHIGTGTVVDRLLDPWTLAGRPRPVTRPHHDWQVYDPQRREKGGVRWHTVEGSFVLHRKGLYYQMFSGGNWKLPGYGVSYAVSPTLDRPGEWEQAADGESILPILRTVPGQVIGPGHNSVVRGPDNRQLYCVYHRWDLEAGARVMAIDPLDWAGERLLLVGPSATPQPAPILPTLADRFDTPGDLGPSWEIGAGAWKAISGEARQSAPGPAWAATPELPPHFLAEVTLRSLAPGAAGGVALRHSHQELLQLLLLNGQAQLRWTGPDGPYHLSLPDLDASMDPLLAHLVRVEVDGLRATLALDGRAPLWSGRLPAPPTRFALAAKGPAAFAGFDLTVGWEDLFPAGPPESLGWEPLAGAWRIENGELRVDARDDGASIAKGPLLDSYDLIVNGRLIQAEALAAGWGLHPASTAHDPGPLLLLEKTREGWSLVAQGPERASFPLPAFDPTRHQQLRLRKTGARLTLQWESLHLGQIEVPSHPSRPTLHVRQAAAAFDAVRVTALP